MKLYVREYEADPPEICAGTVIDSKRVEFSPATGGSGEKDIEDSLNSAPPLEQSVTAPPTKTVKRPSGGRWATMRMVECSHCSFEWQSRTSANAVDAYKAQLVESGLRSERNLKKMKALREKNKSKKK